MTSARRTCVPAVIEARGPHQARVDLAKAPDGAWQKPCVYRSADGETRRGFRHELASCLALFAVLRRHEPTHSALLGPWIDALALMGDGEIPAPVPTGSEPTSLEKQVLACSASEFDLLAYLVLSPPREGARRAARGPKTRSTSHATIAASDPRVREGDALPAIPLDGVSSLPALLLTLAPAALGLSPITGRSWRDRTAALLRTHGPGALAYLEAVLIAADRRASKLPTADPLLTAGTTEGAP